MHLSLEDLLHLTKRDSGDKEMNIDRYIKSMTPDVRMQRILKRAATVDETRDAICVRKAWLSSELTALIKARTPRLGPAIQRFVTAPDPKNIYRGLQVYVWLNEKIPEEQDRSTLILLGMEMYLEGEAKADAAREMVDFLAVK